MGVQHIINYKTDRNWGDTAMSLSPNGDGVQHVIEVGGVTTMTQSMKAIAPEGVISMIGFLAPQDNEPQGSFWDSFSANGRVCIFRGINVGSRAQFREMNQFMETHSIVPIVDEKEFDFEHARDAFEYLREQKFFGKIVINIADK